MPIEEGHLVQSLGAIDRILRFQSRERRVSLSDTHDKVENTNGPKKSSEPKCVVAEWVMIRFDVYLAECLWPPISHAM